MCLSPKNHTNEEEGMEKSLRRAKEKDKCLPVLGMYALVDGGIVRALELTNHAGLVVAPRFTRMRENRTGRKRASRKEDFEPRGSNPT